MWGWLAALVRGFFRAILDFVWDKAKEPDTIEDVKTPEQLKAEWQAYVQDRLNKP
jgi:hypothetical protein